MSETPLSQPVDVSWEGTPDATPSAQPLHVSWAQDGATSGALAVSAGPPILGAALAATEQPPRAPDSLWARAPLHRPEQPIFRGRERAYMAAWAVSAGPIVEPATVAASAAVIATAAIDAEQPPVIIAPAIDWSLLQALDLPDNAGPRIAAPAGHLPPAAQALGLAWAEMLRHQRASRARHAHGIRRTGARRAPHAQAGQRRRSAACAHAHALKRSRSIEFRSTQGLRAGRQAEQPHAHGSKISAGAQIPSDETIKRGRPLAAEASQGLPESASLAGGHAEGTPTANRLSMRWAQMIRPAPGRWWPFYVPPGLNIIIPCSGGYVPRPLHCVVLLHWEPIEQPFCPPLEPPGPGPGIVVPIRRVYFMIPDIEVRRLPDQHLIHARNVDISIDADSHTWACRATLVGKAALDAVQPDQSGQPVTLAIHINGHDWHFVVDSWQEDVQFGSRGIRINGRGLTAELSEPFQLPGAGTVAQGATVQQVLASILPFGEGWGIEWAPGTPDWFVPAGAWSYAGQTPIGAIHGAATALGLVAVPAKTSRSIHIMPRYPVLPWQYQTAEPDLTIPLAAITQYTRQQPIPSQANGVIVHGSEIGGILGQITRTGTAGDRQAPTASHPLITHEQAARLLGGRILAGQHQQPAFRSVTAPLGGDFPLGGIGQLLEIAAGPESARGVISGISIAVEPGAKTTVRQTITIGEATENKWAQFKRLLPEDPLRVADVLTSDGTTGTAIVELLDGSQIRVRGEGTPGQRVYIQGGAIEGNAPNLPVELIQV